MAYDKVGGSIHDSQEVGGALNSSRGHIANLDFEQFWCEYSLHYELSHSVSFVH